MLNEFIEILLGACMEFVPEQYQEIVLAIATPVYVAIILIFVMFLALWFGRTLYLGICRGLD